MKRSSVLVRVMGALFRTFFSIIGTMAVIAVGAPLVLVAIVPLAVVYRIIMRYYLASSRELKRLDSVSRCVLMLRSRICEALTYSLSFLSQGSDILLVWGNLEWRFHYPSLWPKRSIHLQQ